MSRKFQIVIAAAMLAVISLLVYLLIEFDLYHQVTDLINEKTPAEVFIALMVILPMMGVPFTIFILLLAVKFGVLNGLLLLAAVLPLQMLTAYLLVVFIRKPIENYLVVRKNFQLPRIPEDKEFIFSFFMLSLPIFPYAVKIYILPLAGMPFRYCFWLNWAVQGILCIPFVLAGKSVADILGSLFGNSGTEIDYVLLGVTIAFFVVFAVLLRWLKKKYSKLQEEKIS